MSRKKLVIRAAIFSMLITVFFFKYLHFVAFFGSFGDSDTDNYLRHYGDVDSISEFKSDYLYYLSSFVFSQLFSFEFYLAFVVIVFFFSISKYLIEIFGNSYWLPFFLAVSFFYPSYISVTELVIRQGIGFSVLFAFSFYLNSTRLNKKIVFVLIASLFHSSFIFYLIIIFLHEKLINNLKN